MPAGGTRTCGTVHRALLLVVAAILCGGLRSQQPLVAAKGGAEDGDDDEGIQIKEMDLLSGVPALVFALAAFIQILPLPVEVYSPPLGRFLGWLRNSIEEDFAHTLLACSERCVGQNYQPNPYWVDQWLKASLSDMDPIECGQGSPLCVDDLVAVAQEKGSSDLFLRLARLACYPHMRELTVGVRAIQYSPSTGRRFVAFQWFGLFLSYIYHTVFYNGLVDKIRAVRRVFSTLYRRIFLSLRPAQRYGAVCASHGYRISDLARHRIIHEHLHWVRYGIYNMLTEKAGKHICVKPQIGLRGAAFYVDHMYMTPKHTMHPGLKGALLARAIAIDKCSAAKVLYSIAFHSVRVMLLCSEMGYAPPYIIASSYNSAYNTAHREQSSLVLRFDYTPLSQTYSALYYSDKPHDIGLFNADYGILLKALQSPLGDMIVARYEVTVRLDMKLLDMPESMYLHYPEHIGEDGQLDSNGHDWCPDIQVDGISLDRSELLRVFQAQMGLVSRTCPLVWQYDALGLFWGPDFWLLYTLQKALPVPSAKAVPQESKHMRDLYLLPLDIMLMRMSNFQPYLGVRDGDTLASGKAPKGHGWARLWSKVSNMVVPYSSDYASSVPAWCICHAHCRGICTLIVNELDMFINRRSYCDVPYMFSSRTEPKGKYPQLVCLNTKKVLHGANSPSGKGTTLWHAEDPAPVARFESAEYLLSKLLYASTTKTVAIFKDQIIPCKRLKKEVVGEDLYSISRHFKTSIWKSTYKISKVRLVPPRLDEIDNIVLGGINGLSAGRLQYNAAIEAKTKRSLEKPFRHNCPRDD
ncbi:hypothetical protein GGF46_004631 [Coemansia sp. RSA 552]|nr:hypothetical protein GGF46_004631 [Coemansia sp. RSA 552]